MCVCQWEIEEDSERVREKIGGVSVKKSPVVALTPDASSRCESFCPLRLISALLLLMLLFLRRFLYAKERERNTKRGREM